MNNVLSLRLKQMRLSKGWYQKEVAKKLEITESGYGFYEQGKRTPDSFMLNKIANLYGCSTDYLLGNTDLQNPLSSTEKDIAKEVDNILVKLNKEDGYVLEGKPLDEDTKELLKKSLKNSLEIALLMSNQKSKR